VDVVRRKLAAKKTKRQQKYESRDPNIMAKIKAPVFISTKASTGLTTEEIKTAQAEHSRKLIGWKYHVYSKALQESDLQQERKKKRKTR